MRRAPLTTGRRVGGGHVSAGAGVERRAVGIARNRLAARGAGRDLRRDLPPRAEAGIDQPTGRHGIARRRVIRKVLGLAADGRREAQAEPVEVGQDAGHEFGSGTAEIDVLDAQEQAPAPSLGDAGVQERGIRVTEMQVAVRARREAQHRCWPRPFRQAGHRSRRCPRHGSPASRRQVTGPGVQAMPGSEQAVSSPIRRQTLQPSPHSEQL